MTSTRNMSLSVWSKN